MPLLFAALVSAAVSAAAPEDLWRQVEGTRLADGPPIAVDGLRLRFGMATFDIERGRLFLATAVGERAVEMVFIGRAELVLGRCAAARRAFDRADQLADRSIRFWLENELVTLEARLAIHARDYDQAYKLLRKAILRRQDLGSTEGLLLLAIAARQTGHRDDAKDAMRRASEKGADVTLLSHDAPQG